MPTVRSPSRSPRVKKLAAPAKKSLAQEALAQQLLAQRWRAPTSEVREGTRRRSAGKPEKPTPAAVAARPSRPAATALRDELARRVSEVEELQRDLVIAKTAESERRRQLDALGSRIEGECRMIAERSERRARLLEDVSELRHAVAKRDAELTGARHEIAALKRELVKERAGRAEIGEERDRIRSALARTQETLGESRAEIDALQARLPDPSLDKALDTALDEAPAEANNESTRDEREAPQLASSVPPVMPTAAIETAAQPGQTDLAELPEPDAQAALSAIFVYWRNARIRAQLADFEIEDTQHFFTQPIAQRCDARPGDRIRILSLARDDARFEIDLAERLLEHGMENFRFECVDLRSEVRERRLIESSDEGLAAFVMNLERSKAFADAHRYDVVLANGSLWGHTDVFAKANPRDATLQTAETTSHLGAALDALARTMRPDATLALMETLEETARPLSEAALPVAEQIWQLMPSRYRKGSAETVVSNGACNGDPQSKPLADALRERFHDEAWAAFGHLVDAFIGPLADTDFDPDIPADRRFIDQVAKLDEARIAAGVLNPRHLAAWLRPRSD